MKITVSHLIISLSLCSSALLGSLMAAGPARAERPAEHPENSEKALKLWQTHYFTGTNEIIVAPHALRLENTGRLKFRLVARAPDWKVTIFRDDDKTYFSESLAQFQESGLVSEFLVGRKRRYEISPEYRRSNIVVDGRKAVRMTSIATTFKFLPLDQALHADPQIEQLFYGIHKMSTQGGIPLYRVGTRGANDFMGSKKDSGTREDFLDTSKIEEIKVAPSIFNPPVGYTRAKSVREVVAGVQSRLQSTDVGEFFDGPGDKRHK